MTYPKTLNHPLYKPAVIERPTHGAPLKPGEEPQAPQAAVFPPVTVNDEIQENHHRALGYVEQGETMSEYVYQEYPKYVGDKIVNSAEEEAALTGFEPAHEEPAVDEPDPRDARIAELEAMLESLTAPSAMVNDVAGDPPPPKRTRKLQ